MCKLFHCAALAIALQLIAAGVLAQDKYPSKPIRLLTPFAPGGGSDILARIIGPQVSEVFGQSIIVENRPGGGGTVGAGITVRSDPDGYNLILVSGSYGANGALHDLPRMTKTASNLRYGRRCLGFHDGRQNHRLQRREAHRGACVCKDALQSAFQPHDLVDQQNEWMALRFRVAHRMTPCAKCQFDTKVSTN